MQQAIIDGTPIAYSVHGSGEAIILLHCGFVADSFVPLINEAALSEYQMVNYHRRGYGESPLTAGVVPYERHAADCLALMDKLGIEKAHLAGHSIGGSVAVQVALDAPSRVATLMLLEPTLLFGASPASQALFGQVISEAFEHYNAGDIDGAVDTWLNVPFGSGYRAVMERTLPGSTKGMATAAKAVFESEAPALQMWRVGPAEMQRLQMPVLSVYHSDPQLTFFEEGHQAVVALVPQAESLRVEHVTHMLQLQEPAAVAEGLAAFLHRHPIRNYEAIQQ